MSNIPAELNYTKTHEWARRNEDGTLTVGITDHAQAQLGDMVFVELPDVGRILQVTEECAVVESVKAASDVYSPVAGEVLEVNDALTEKPELINQDPYGAGWIFRMQPTASLDDLLDAASYAALEAAEAE
jgi:glycine cleavage system H protein